MILKALAEGEYYILERLDNGDLRVWHGKGDHRLENHELGPDIKSTHSHQGVVIF